MPDFQWLGLANPDVANTDGFARWEPVAHLWLRGVAGCHRTDLGAPNPFSPVSTCNEATVRGSEQQQKSGSFVVVGRARLCRGGILRPVGSTDFLKRRARRRGIGEERGRIAIVRARVRWAP